MASKMAQDSGKWVKIASDTRPRGLKTVSGAVRGSRGTPQEAKIIQQLMGNQCVLPFRCFASGGLLRPQSGPNTAQDCPKR
eukprot:4062385-Pyramimonas_sp.AAC.1